MWKTVLLGLVFSVLLQVGNAAIPEDPVKKSPADLRRDIFKNYDPKVLPVKNAEENVRTEAAVAPIFVREMDEEKEILVLDAWLLLKWNDSHLHWNPDEYGGIKSLNLPASEVWKPDITPYTASPDIKLVPQVLTNAIVSYNGEIMWVPPLTIYSRCPLDLSHYPYDTQECLIKLGSWTYSASGIDLYLYTPTVDLSDFSDYNQEWTVVGATVERHDNYYPCCPGENYPSINYNFTLKRRRAPEMSISNSVSCFAVFLSILMFWLPPDSTHKIILGALAEVLLGMVVLYLGSAIEAPVARMKAAARVFPYMCVVAGAMILELLILNLGRVMGPCKPPRFLLAIAKGCCQPFCVCASRPFSGGELENEVLHPEKAKKQTASAQEEWNLVAMAFDRVLFFFAVLTSVFCFYVYK